jgi:uncharacterized protein DUF3800
VCAESQIEILARLVHPRDRKWKKRFVFFESYMDESGIHEGAKICTVAGYYGTELAWKRFEKEWHRVLKGHGLEDIGFHAKDFWRKENGKRVVPPYDQWDDVRANRFIERLLQAILRNRIFPFGHGVVTAHWESFSLEARKLLTGARHHNGKFVTSGSPDRSYYLAFMFCVLDSVRHSGTRLKVNFFAGLDKSFSDYASILYKQVCDDPNLSIHHLLGTIAFPLSKDTPQLQAADLLVYRLYRHNMARFKGPTTKLRITKLLVKNRHPHQPFELFNRQAIMKLLLEYRDAARAAKGRCPYIPEFQEVSK